ncbi:glycosyltransferase [Brevundimonas sp. VNH65]|uniref:glycosyltransferase n=1 Tax=Brevundimonas sp. VNH65 TaxID=3400917 RepID=UPI003C116C0B
MSIRPEDLLSSEEFDGDWYAARYPDVGLSGLSPVEHYWRFGAVLGRDAGPVFSPVFHDAACPPPDGPSQIPALFRHLAAREAGTPVMDGGRVLYAAACVQRRLDYARARTIAERHIPPELAHTLAMLDVNRHAAGGESRALIEALNTYLAGAASPAVRRARVSDNIINDLEAVVPEHRPDGPLVSVLMTTFNAADTVEAAVTSILNQSWRRLELIIIDDGSTDDTWKRLKALEPRDQRISLHRNPVNMGAYVSKNIASRLAKGLWLTCQDADDWSHPRRIADHMDFVARERAAVSVMRMVRLRSDGSCRSLSPVSRNSPDGVAKEAPISALIRRDFFDQNLGAWDSVKVGGDSEMLHRARTTAPSAYVDFPYVGMICLDGDHGLTSDPVLGINHVSGPTGPRRAYVEAWRAWHQTLASGGSTALAFPPNEIADRPFAAPEPFLAPAPAARRAFYAIAGVERLAPAPTTMVCVSKRPEFAPRIARMMDEQRHPDLSVVFVADGYDGEIVRAQFRQIAKVTILRGPADAPLGALLNLGVDASDTDLVAKIDDDDHYGPNYIRRAVAALMHNEHDHVALTGKALAYCHVESGDAFGLPQGGARPNALVERVFGGTLLWSRDKASHQRFEARPHGEDQAFCQALLDGGKGVWSADPYDYVYVRRGPGGHHAWSVDDETFAANLGGAPPGLDLDAAFS